MKKNRDEIISKILMACLIPTSKTRVILICNLNFKTAKPYLELLAQTGHIEWANDTRKYQTTDNGKLLLNLIRKVNNIL